MSCARTRHSRCCGQIGTCAAIGLRGVGRQEHAQRQHRHRFFKATTTICWRANVAGSAVAVEEVARIVLRADSGFANEELMAWCEANRVGYVCGLARNSRLEAALAAESAAAERQHPPSPRARIRLARCLRRWRLRRIRRVGGASLDQEFERNARTCTASRPVTSKPGMTGEAKSVRQLSEATTTQDRGAGVAQTCRARGRPSPVSAAPMISSDSDNRRYESCAGNGCGKCRSDLHID
jgi:hypothetical protein